MIAFKCRKHPTYKARRDPVAKCEACLYIRSFVRTFETANSTNLKMALLVPLKGAKA